MLFVLYCLYYYKQFRNQWIISYSVLKKDGKMDLIYNIKCILFSAAAALHADPVERFALRLCLSPALC